MRCANGEGDTRRCQWEGTYGKLQRHADECDFIRVPCPNSCEDDRAEIRHFMRRDIRDHVLACPYREHKCPHCEETGAYSHITDVHSLQGTHVPVCIL